MRTETCVRRAVAAAIATTFISAHDARATEPSTEDPRLRAIRTCAALGNDVERLACFDEVASTLTTGTAAKSAPASAEEMFGVRRQSDEKRSDAVSRQAPLAEITARVATLREPRDGRTIIELDNGQIWQQLDAQTTLLLRAGDTVKISRGAFSTFRLLAPSGRFARVSRVR